MAEGARLESVYTATYPGFESPPHRHILRRARTKVRAFFSHVAHLRGDEKPRPGFDTKLPGAILNSACAGPVGARPRDGPSSGAASWTDRERSEWAARRASKASQSPPHRHILRRARTQVRAFFRMLHLPDAAQAPYPAYIATALHISVGLISEAPSGMAVIVG